MNLPNAIWMSAFAVSLSFLLGCGSQSTPTEAAPEQPVASSAAMLREQVDAVLKSKDTGTAASVATTIQESLGAIEKQNPTKSANIKRLRDLASQATAGQDENMMGVMQRIRTELASLE